MSQPVDTSSGQANSSPEDETARYQSLLASDERVLLVRRRHWFTFIQAARWFLLLIVIGVLVAILDGEVSNDLLSTILSWGFGICFLLGLAGVGWYVLAWQRERYLVTTRRVIETSGVINKESRDTSLEMITDMIVTHPWTGRLLGYGEIDLLTASEAGTNKIRYLPDADGFKRSLLDAKDALERDIADGGRRPVVAASAPAPAPAPAAEPAPTTERLTAEEVDASISHLATMRDRGLITAAEFDEKKKQILDRL